MYVRKSIQQTVAVSEPPNFHPMVGSDGIVTPPWQAWFNAFYTRLGRGANDTAAAARDAAELAGIGADQSGDIADAEDRLRDEIAAQVEGVSNQAFQDYVTSQFMYETDWSQQINDAVDAVIPSQTGNADKVLSTDGTNIFWRGSYYQSSGLSDSYGVTDGVNTGGFNTLMGGGGSATWLLSGTSGGVFRAGIQALNAGGAIRFYDGTDHMDFAAGALTVPGNVSSGGSTVLVDGAANTKFTLGNTTNSQLWSFSYNAGSTLAGIYDGTATVYRLYFNDGTGEANFTANVASTTTTTGTVIVTGGVGVSGQVTAGTFKGNGAALTNLPIVAPAYQEFVATAAQTVFNTTINTTAKAAGKSYLQVFVNGIFQQEGAAKAYTVTGANQVTFNAGLVLSDDVVMYSFS